MPRLEAVIHRGAFFDTLLANVGDAPWAERFALPSGIAEDAILASGKTVYELFREAVEAPPLRSEDTEMIRCLEQLSLGQREKVRAVIYAIAEPWWLDYMIARPIIRFTEVMRRKHKQLLRKASAERNPHLAKMLPCHSWQRLQTDIVPFLADETGCSIQWLMVLGEQAPIYSRVPGVDLLYMEYTLLDRELQIIPRVYAAELKRRA